MQKTLELVLTWVMSVALMVSIVLYATGCATPGKNTAIGSGAGAGVGAAIGALGAGGKGAALGALAGAATGAVVGNYLDKQAAELQEIADTKRVEDGILVNVKSDLLFDTGSSQVKTKAGDQLVQLGNVLAKYKADRIRVEGFTDSTGSAAFNDKLSRQRADAVREVLLSEGVKPDQILVFGYGESRPVASNSTPQGRQLNRRVDLIIDVPQEKQAEVEKSRARVPASK